MRTIPVLIQRYPRAVNGTGASRPATRLLTMLEVLQACGTVSGRELAERLEVDPRTVRRYAVKLEELGIPVETERGPSAATASSAIGRSAGRWLPSRNISMGSSEVLSMTRVLIGPALHVPRNAGGVLARLDLDLGERGPLRLGLDRSDGLLLHEQQVVGPPVAVSHDELADSHILAGVEAQFGAILA